MLHLFQPAPPKYIPTMVEALNVLFKDCTNDSALTLTKKWIAREMLTENSMTTEFFSQGILDQRQLSDARNAFMEISLNNMVDVLKKEKVMVHSPIHMALINRGIRI